MADNIVSFNGKDYLICDNTILLDCEGIFGNVNSFKSADEAFKKINETNGNITLLVAPSVYWLDDPDDPSVRSDKGGTPFAEKINCDSLSIIGLSNSPEDVVFAVNRGQTQGAIGNFTMFLFSGKNLTIENITFGNYCNVDLEYPRRKEFNRGKRKDAIVQAQIGICKDTERLYSRNCRFISRLNLCPFVGARRSLYQGCYFECTDDALSGSAVYLDCTFTFFSSKPFYSTAETGAVFINCDITSLCSGTQYFTKVPGMVTVIDTRFKCDNPIDIRWTRDPSDIISYQHNVTLNGKHYTIDASRPSLWKDLTKSPVKDAFLIESEGKYNYNLPNLLDDKIGLPVTLRVRSDKSTLHAQNDIAKIIATPLLWGGYVAGDPSSIKYVSHNSKPESQVETVEISHPCGLSAIKTITVEPYLKKAPKLKGKPEIRYDSLSKQYMAAYKLSGKGVDESLISWGRLCEDEDGNQKAILLKQSFAGEDCGFSPKAGDLGCKIVAVIMPKYKDSQPGEPSVSEPVDVFDKRIIEEFPEATLTTDFKDIPISKRTPGFTGVWCFDLFKPYDTREVDWEISDGPGWYYGKGFDASTGEGILQSEKGARLSYLPERDSCNEMEAILIVEPAKSGGQGFGSATKQYMDICVKFNPVTLDGYALRIERTPEHDKAVNFSLVKYDKGITTVINEGVVSNCYRSPCKIIVSFKDGVLNASATTEAPATKACCSETKENVDISAEVPDNGYAGFCLQHTGSTGPSSTLIRNVELRWN